MEDTTPPPSARMRDGTPYVGIKQYAGLGRMRSCGKCGQHRLQAAGQGRMSKRLGWVCGQCTEGV